MGKRTKKVFVALSGGRDSAVAAWLLKKQGFEVKGVFFRLHNLSKHEKAVQAARRIGIPFVVWDFRKEFKKEIINDFIRQYKKGDTPNPCVSCNRLIKFGLFYKRAKKEGADFISTGHYARIFKKDNQYLLAQARDRQKDQSYFLWGIKKNLLKEIIFPLGHLTAQKVEKIARKNQLAGKKYQSSQEICFVPETVRVFLKKNIKAKKGKIIDIKSGQAIGVHPGVYFYTLGQREGIGLNQGPWYVVKKDPAKNILFVSQNKKNLLTRKVKLMEINLVKKIKFPFKAKVKTRFRHPGAQAIVRKIENRIVVDFKKPERALTPGQACVFYQGDILIGGGIIKK